MKAINERKSVLIYHVYLRNNWKELTSALFMGIPHDDICVNVNVDWFLLWKFIPAVIWFKKDKKVKKVFFTINSTSKAEVLGFKKLRYWIQSRGYSLVTYMHGKGVTKPYNQNIKDWVELMRYFIVDRSDLCLEAFDKNYKLYGVNLEAYKVGNGRSGPYKFSEFHFSGNFVSINLDLLSDKFFSTEVDEDYFGIEGFWGKLCPISEVYCPFISNVDHYQTPFPKQKYC